jgi:aldose sugar dehydrogenase
MNHLPINRRLPVARPPLAILLPILVAGCQLNGEAVEPRHPVDIGRQDGPVRFEVTTVTEGLEHPWGMAFLPGDEGILVTERPGRLRLVQGGQLRTDPIRGVPEVRARGQGGLLDVALHPEFATNRYVYLTYSKPGQRGGTTALARGRLEGGALTGVQDLFVADAWSDGGQHFGSRIVFDRSGYLYLTIGDRGDGPRAQNLGDHTGSVIRLHDDGRVPADNPFVGRAGARPEIFSYGHRNPQGMVLHPETGEVWLNEHGPRGGDEINRVVAGRNYGWPEFSFGNHYDGRRIPNPDPSADLEMPLLHWTPSIAPSGMTFYTGDAFPGWRGSVFVGALAGEHLRRVEFDGSTPVREETLLSDRGWRIRAVATGPDGFLYLLVDDRRGRMVKIGIR